MSAIAQLCSVLHQIDTSRFDIREEPWQGCERIVLPEDHIMEGFTPTMSVDNTQNKPWFIEQGVDKVKKLIGVTAETS